MWLQAILLLLFLLVVVIGVVVFYGNARWRSRTVKLHEEMQAARFQTSTKTYDPRDLADLPAPVQRYLGAVLKDGQALVSAVRVNHTGTFNMSETAEQWKPFRSTQRVITHRPGFVWDARIGMAPGMTVFVRDAYVAGEGILVAKLYGLLTVMEQPSTPELAQGELMRFIAEGAWYPTIFLPGQGVHWQAEDDMQASATLSDGATTLKLVFSFDPQGLISSVRSAGRYREVDGVQVATPWQGRFWDYQLHEGMLVPLEGEVAWLLPEGPKPYWRGRIDHIEYEFVR